MDPENTFTQPVHAELARALAQSVAGYWLPEMYFTASFTQLPETSNPYDISQAFTTYAAAEQSLQQSSPPKAGYGIFGPFANSMGGLLEATIDQDTVAQIQVTTSGSPPSTFGLPQDGPGQLPYDAMFFTVEAVAKFVVPYYTTVYGTGFAQAVLQSFQQSTLALMVHLPWSESEDLSAQGQPEAFVAVNRDGSQQQVGGSPP